MRAGNRAAQYLYMSLTRGLQPDDGAHQDRLTRARSADHAQNFTALYLQRQIVVNAEIAELINQPFDYNRVFAAIQFGNEVGCIVLDFIDQIVAVRHAQPNSVKNTAKNASSTMTAKIACTTAIVVRLPTSSEFPSTCIP